LRGGLVYCSENIEWNKWAVKWDEAKEGEWDSSTKLATA